MKRRIKKWLAHKLGFRIKWIGEWQFKHIDKDGNLLWDSGIIRNALVDEGEENILDLYLRGQNAPATFYIRLFNDTPVETDSISDLTGEASGNGYAAQEVPRDTNGWPTLVLDSGDFQATSSEETFSASGGSWGPVTHAVLTTSTDSSGLLISFVALDTPRTVNDGESILVTMNIKLA